MLIMLRSLELSDVAWDDEDREWDMCLAKTSWVARSTYNTILMYTPGELAFSCNMTIQ